MHHNQSHEDHNSTEPSITTDEDTDTTSDQLIPLPRAAAEDDESWNDSWITGRDWRVERIDTEPMTQQQHDAAVTALAALINQWLGHQSKPSQDRGDDTGDGGNDT